MKINKSLNIDLNIISPQKHIRIHEGDVDSVDILIGVTVDDESVDLDGVTIKYDATINNYLAEQDADGSVVDGKISIPVTQNMTAMSGLLLIDVRMIQSDQILFTQTICATVEKAVVNGSTYIDFDKITIIQRMNALEEKMDYIEELVENFDTSKLIVSVNRPPMGAPVEVDVDLLRVGDTWILSGDNIVYKLVEAQYNYQPVPDIEPYHKFTWQSLNARLFNDNVAPPTSKTYQPIVYTINEVQWSWLPVPEYFQGDHYQMQIGFDDPTYYICKSALMRSAGVCIYNWREEGGSIDAYTKAETNALLADKMDLAPINPTAEQIAAMLSGQLYGDTVNHKGIIKGGQEFYDTTYIDTLLVTKEKAIRKTRPPYYFIEGSDIEVGDLFIYNTKLYMVNSIASSGVPRDIYYTRIGRRFIRTSTSYVLPTSETNSLYVSQYDPGDIVVKSDMWYPMQVHTMYICSKAWAFERGKKVDWTYEWKEIPSYYADSLSDYNITDAYTKTEVDTALDNKADVATTLAGYGITDAYTKTEINAMIPTVPTNISAFTNDSGYLTLGTLPIYDGTVI